MNDRHGMQFVVIMRCIIEKKIVFFKENTQPNDKMAIKTELKIMKKSKI